MQPSIRPLHPHPFSLLIFGLLGAALANDCSVIEEIGKELAGKVTVAKVNVDEAAGVAGTHKITAIPTLLISGMVLLLSG